MQTFGKTKTLNDEHFADFITAYTAADRNAVNDDRFCCFIREQIAAKNNSLDLGLIRDDSIIDYEDMQDPIESGEEVVAKLEEAVDLIQSVLKELRSLEA